MSAPPMGLNFQKCSLVIGWGLAPQQGPDESGDGDNRPRYYADHADQYHGGFHQPGRKSKSWDEIDQNRAGDQKQVPQNHQPGRFRARPRRGARIGRRTSNWRGSGRMQRSLRRLANVQGGGNAGFTNVSRHHRHYIVKWQGAKEWRGGKLPIIRYNAANVHEFD